MDDGPLDMRMDKSQKLTAEYIVNNYKEQDLERLQEIFANIEKIKR